MKSRGNGFLYARESIVVYMKEKKETFNEYIDRLMGDEIMLTLSIDAIQDDWNITDKELFFCLSCINNFEVKRHPDHQWHITLINIEKARAITERKKDKESHR